MVRALENLLTIKDLSELLSVPVSWVYDRLRPSERNRLPGFKLGKYWRFRESEVIAWLEARRV